MAEVAAVLVDERADSLHSSGVDRIAGRLRRRERRKSGSHVAQVVVFESLHDLVHRFVEPEFVAKHEQLNREVKFGLASQRGNFGASRLTVGAVAGEAGREPS